jgi:hypothetical protein
VNHDRRAHPRQDLRKDGKIVFVDQPFFVECAIRDISDGGALLTLLVNYPLQRTILLWREDSNAIFECEVRWRRDLLVGVHFLDVCGRRLRQALLEKCFAPVSCSQPMSRLLH